jgi:hypothetical protein
MAVEVHRTLSKILGVEAALSLGDVLTTKEKDCEPNPNLGPAANAIERRAQLTAEAEGRHSSRLGQRGARVHSVRHAEAVVAEMCGRLELVREACPEAQQEGRGQVMSVQACGFARYRKVAGEGTGLRADQETPGADYWARPWSGRTCARGWCDPRPTTSSL